MTTNHRNFVEVNPIDATLPGTGRMEALVERLRSVRLKVGRWLPNADALEAWSADYAEVYRAATRLESAVRALDTHLAASPCDDLDASGSESLELQLLLVDVEACADAFEESVIENLAGSN